MSRLVGSSQMFNPKDLKWDDIAPLRELFNRITATGDTSDRCQNINIMTNTEPNDEIQGLAAFFDGGADANVVRREVLDRSGIHWHKQEDLPAKQRTTVTQYNGQEVTILGVTSLQWWFPDFEGIPFTISVKVVPSTGNPEQPDLLIGDCFTRQFLVSLDAAQRNLEAHGGSLRLQSASTVLRRLYQGATPWLRKSVE